MSKHRKHNEDMTTAELARATQEFDRPFAFENARPMTNAERKQERRLRRRRGRPRTGKGARKISVSLESDLLRATDALAKARGVNRSKLISDFVMAGLKRRAS